jgi:hypothetical protein
MEAIGSPRCETPMEVMARIKPLQKALGLIAADTFSKILRSRGKWGEG